MKMFKFDFVSLNYQHRKAYYKKEKILGRS